MATESSSPFDFLSGLFPNKQEKIPESPKKPKLPDVVIDSDYTLSYVFAAIGIFIILTSPDKTCVPGSSFVCPPSIWGVVQGGLNLLFASFLAVQARRIRFVFDETSFELKNVEFGASKEEVLRASGENFVVGGANRWDYDKFVNYDFFPSVDYPVLVYFKETQTPSEKWKDGPGGFDKVGGGQVGYCFLIIIVRVCICICVGMLDCLIALDVISVTVASLTNDIKSPFLAR
jgi:hypothetical protein